MPPHRGVLTVIQQAHVARRAASLHSTFDDYDVTDPDQSLAFEDVEVGSGDDVATAGKMVTIAYKGMILETGEVFDQDLMYGISFILGSGRVIPGWEQGIEVSAIMYMRRCRAEE